MEKFKVPHRFAETRVGKFLLPLAVPLISFYAQEAQAVVKPEIRYETAQILERIKAKKQPAHCSIAGNKIEHTKADGSVKVFTDVFTPGERPREIVCGENRIFIRTERSLVTLFNEPERTITDDEVGITLIQHVSRADLRNILPQGHALVSWTCAPDDVCYFLTGDGVLSRIPVDEEGRATRTFRLKADVSGAKMVAFSGLLFAGPISGQIMAMSFSNGFEHDSFALPEAVKDGGFFVKEGKLFFGKEAGENVEIKVNGENVKEISLGP